MRNQNDHIFSVEGNAIVGSRAVLYGNNAAWECINPACRRLCLARSDSDNSGVLPIVSCDCGREYRLEADGSLQRVNRVTCIA
jgi:hypothetical protein